MNGAPTLPPGNSGFERLIEALRRKNRDLNGYASEILYRLRKEMDPHKQVVPMLVREACCKGKQPEHRIRILDVVQRIGEPLDAESFFDLTFLTGHRVPKVGLKAAEVIATIRPSAKSAVPR